MGHIAQHSPGSTGEQHGPQRGTMLKTTFLLFNCLSNPDFELLTQEIGGGSGSVSRVVAHKLWGQCFVA